MLRTLVELADCLVADHGVADVLSLLCDRAVGVLGADGAGVLRMDASGNLDVAAASSNEMHSLVALEARAQAGPCVEAHRCGRVVDAPDLAEATLRWPAYVREAAARGYRGVHARPLRVRGDHIGALSLARRTVGELVAESRAVAGAMADMAAIAISHQRALGAADERARQLRQALDSRIVVEQASAVLADRENLDVGAAFGRLRRYARDHNERLQVTARRFLDGQIDTATFRSR